MAQRNSLTYRNAGVDIDRGNRLVERIRTLVAPTQGPEVLAGIGGFGAMFEMPVDRYRRPVLVAGTDGVGTKLRLAIDCDRHEVAGIDLVAMCANDILAQGAEPLFFLDYFATGRLEEDTAARVISGIVTGCTAAGAALIGGETAEMPGMYAGDDYDIAGFCVGVVERDEIIDGRDIGPGDALIGLASSGPHANGYSLIRRCLEVSGASLDAGLGSGPASITLRDALLAPTRVYARPTLDLRRQIEVKGIAHITGGGLIDNVPRMLPEGLRARLDSRQWPEPPVFDWIRQVAGATDREMYRTFNCGIGMVVCVGSSDIEAALQALKDAGERPFQIGEVLDADGTDRVAVIG